MNEESGGRGAWYGLFIAGIAAVIFLVLWYMKLGDARKLESELASLKSSSAAATRRLEDDVRNAKNETATAGRKISELEDRLRTSDFNASQTASQLERRLRSEVGTVERRLIEANEELEKLKEIADTEKARAEALEAEAEGIKEAARIEKEKLDASLKTVSTEKDKLNARLVELTGERETLIAEADRLKATAAELEKRLADEAQKPREDTSALSAARDAELAELNTRLESANRLLAEARTASTEQDKARGALSKELEKVKSDAASRERELNTILAELKSGAAKKTETDPGSPVNGDAAVWKEKADALDKELTDIQSSVEAERKEAEKRLEALKKTHADSMADIVRDSADKLAALEKGAANRVAKLEREHAGELAESRKILAARDEEIKKLRDELESLQDSHARSLQNALSGFERERQKLEADHAQQVRELTERITELEKRAGKEPGSTALGKPGRVVGEIAERLRDNQTLLIKGGINQRLQAGIKFDVYRAVCDKYRYIGTIKTIRVMDDYSMVVSTYDDADVMVCPITGRAVLETGAKYSPFAIDKAGKPVELQKAGMIGLSLEAPAVGDFLDNPFYDPERRLSFAISTELASDICVVKAVENLGGTPRGADAQDADFLVVRDDAAAQRIQGEKRRVVTLSHLASYLDPAPVFQ